MQNALTSIGLNARVKWPNDVYVGQKKIAGILIENQLQGTQIRQSIIGVGLNVNQTKFPEGLNATSCMLELKNTQDLDHVFLLFYKALDDYYDLLKREEFQRLKDMYYSHLLGYKEERFFQINEEKKCGIIQGVNTSGQLELLVGGETQVFDLKEVKFLF